MKIPRELPQFNKEKTLIIVTGEREATFYIANKGEIRELESFRVPKPEFSDKEGRFGKRGRGGFLSSVSPYEFPKEKLRENFLKELEKVAKEIVSGQRIESLYIFSPEHMINFVKQVLPAKINEPKMCFKGDFSHHHPIDLLKRIKEQREKSNG